MPSTLPPIQGSFSAPPLIDIKRAINTNYTVILYCKAHANRLSLAVFCEAAFFTPP